MTHQNETCGRKSCFRIPLFESFFYIVFYHKTHAKPQTDIVCQGGLDSQEVLFSLRDQQKQANLNSIFVEQGNIHLLTYFRLVFVRD